MLSLFIGKRELGKTTLAVFVSQSYAKRVIFDPRHMINTAPLVLSEGQIKGVLYEILDARADVVIRPKFDVQTAFDEMCSEIMEWIDDNPNVKFCLFIDEIRFIQSPESNQYFDFIVRCTDGNMVAVLMTMHGIPDASTDLRRIADFLVLFQLTLAADVDTIRERCGDEVAEKVQTLKPYQYIVWNDRNGSWKEHYDSAKWFVPIQRKVA